MKNKVTVLALLIFIFMNMSFAQTIREVPGTYTTIQAAINAAFDGDVVNVAADTYTETLTITKAIILKGANYGVDARGTRGAETIISSSNTSGSIQIGPVSGTVVIDGFTFGGSPYKAIHVTGITTTVIVKNNIIESAGADGINLFMAQNAVVEYNWVKGAGTSGITAGNTNPTVVTIQYNKVDNSKYGIAGYTTTGSSILENIVNGTNDPLITVGGIAGQFNNTTIEGNTVTGFYDGANPSFTAAIYVGPDITGSFPNRIYGDVLIQNNSLTNNKNQVILSSDITVRTSKQSSAIIDAVRMKQIILDNTFDEAIYITTSAGTLRTFPNPVPVVGIISGLDYAKTKATVSGDIVNIETMLVSPANTITGLPIQPELRWVGGTGTFTLKIATSIAGLATAPTYYAGTNLTYTLTEAQKLNNNATYYWQVSSEFTNDSGLHTILSTIWSFKTTPKVNVYNSNPITGAANVVFNQCTFGWYIGNDASSLKFTLEYAQSTTAPNWLTVPKTEVDNNSDLTYDAALDAGTKYYWRIVVKDADDYVVSYSNNFYFTTKSGSYKPYLSHPVFGMPVNEDGLIFYWYIGIYDLTDLSFEVKIYDGIPGSPGTSQVGATFTTTDLSADLSSMGIDLDGGSTYYWTVTCIYKGSITDRQTSTAGKFKIQDNSTAVKPYLSYPVGNVTVYTTTPTFYWYTGQYNEGLKFDFYIAKYADSYPGTAAEADIEDYYYEYAGTPLEAGETYKWKIVANGSGGSTQTSSDGKFKVASSLSYGTPIASWPLGNPTYYSGDITLYWYISGATTGIDYYQVYYNTTAPNWSTLSSATETVSDPDVLYLEVSGLSAGTYYWGVRAHYTNGTYSAWYHTNTKFKIEGSSNSVGVPYVSAPTGGITINATSATLYWYVIGDATNINLYKVKWSRTSNWSLSDSMTTADQYAEVADLVPGATYWWKVFASTNGGTTWGTVSNPVGRFVVAPTASSSVVPIVGNPINEVSLNATAATLSWFTPVPAQTQLKYNLEYATNEEFSNSKVVADLTEQEYTLEGLESDKTYYWRVEAITEAGINSGFSNTGVFNTSNNVTAVEEEQLPLQFMLNQNYPNPFNPTTTISYSLPQNSFVTLKIYDMLGREVNTLVNQNMNAGNMTVNWNGDDSYGNKVASGAYVYRITAGSFVATKKMLLLK